MEVPLLRALIMCIPLGNPPDYGCRDYAEGCCNDTASAPPIPVLAGPGQAAADAYNAARELAIQEPPSFVGTPGGVPGPAPLPPGGEVLADLEIQGGDLSGSPGGGSPATSLSPLVLVAAALVAWMVVKK